MHPSYHSTACKRSRFTISPVIHALCIFGVAITAQAQYLPPPPDEFEHDGWIATQLKGVIVKGRDATFQQRHQMPEGLSGGVTSFFWETYPTDDFTFRIESHSIFDGNDNYLKFDLFNPEGGFIQAGFRQTRHWYDGSGGFFPPTDLWFRFRDDRMHLDVGEAWIEAGFAKPGQPRASVRYTHSFRRGEKDSTILGRTGLTDGAGNRAIVPSYRDIDETRHIVEGTVEHTLGDTDFGASLRYETSSQDNSLNLVQFHAQPNEERITQDDGVKSDLFSTYAWSSSQLTEIVRLSTSYLYSRIKNDVTGDRILFDPLTGTFDGYFLDMEGRTRMRQHVANVNLLLTPREHFLIIPSVRFEKQEIESIVTHVRNGLQEVSNDRERVNLSQRLEFRYTGIPKWRLYARGDWLQGDGDLRDFTTTTEDRVTDLDRRQQRYTLGANWNPNRTVTASTQYYYAIRKNDYDHTLPGRIGRHPAFLEKQDFETHGFNVRVTTRPANGITLVSRYDLQLTEIDTQGSREENGQQVSLAKIQSGDMTRHTFSQTVTWSPLDRLYLQASGNYAISRIETPANTITGEAWENRVLESRNDYLYAGLTVLFAYSEKTDLNLTYSYYLADNFVDNWESSVAYGVAENEHGIKAGLAHRVHENLVWDGGYGYYRFREDTTGGNRDYDAHLLYSGFTLRF